MKLRTITDLKHLRGARVLVRIDANVPMHAGAVRDDARLIAALPTIEYLTGRGAIVILLAHLGRPNGRTVKELSLAPVARRLSQLSGRMVGVVPDVGGEASERAIAAAVPGQVLMLENLRFDKGEESNSGSFAKRLALLGSAYVNDAFGDAHRAHASVVAITRYHTPYAGLLMERELRVLTHVRTAPRSPSVLMLGGAKISGKIGVIRALGKSYDAVLLGGGLVNAVLAAQGFGIGSSYNERGTRALALQVLKMKNLVLPADVLVGNVQKPSASVRVVPIATDAPFSICKGSETLVDIGPRTILRYAQLLKRARTIVWNGPMGIFETPRFAHGTIALARVIAARSRGRALGVVGGGETVEAIDRTKMAGYIDHVSTGGGAMLEFLEGRVLPGVKPLYAAMRRHATRKIAAKKKR
jgi:phosphoglycerate kinase